MEKSNELIWMALMGASAAAGVCAIASLVDGNVLLVAGIINGLGGLYSIKMLVQTINRMRRDA